VIYVHDVTDLSSIVREPSARELAEHAALANETNEALRKLGFAYSIILLGIGTSQYHHMGAGRLVNSIDYTILVSLAI
jgi:fructoselysine-6-P-deglycase FrlB-like protein